MTNNDDEERLEEVEAILDGKKLAEVYLNKHYMQQNVVQYTDADVLLKAETLLELRKIRRLLEKLVS